MEIHNIKSLYRIIMVKLNFPPEPFLLSDKCNNTNIINT